MHKHIYNRILATICLAVVLLTTCVRPMYSKYVLSENGLVLTSIVSGSVYTVTYMNESMVYKVDYVWNNSNAYPVLATEPEDKPEDADFGGWKYLGGTNPVTLIHAGNISNHVLYATWVYANKHTIRFVDSDATLLYEEVFVEGSSTLTESGIVAVEAKRVELENLANKDSAETNITFKVSWSDYNLSTATSDITVRAVYTMTNDTGSATIEPEYGENGEVAYYKVVSTAGLSGDVTIPGMIGGIPVSYVEDISADTLNTTLTKVTFLEGVERIGANALAMTSGLKEVELPNSLKQIEKNAFSSVLGGLAQKKLTIYYHGTYAQWQQVQKLSGWETGLVSGTRIICDDGTVLVLEVTGGLFGWGSTYTWNVQE